MDNDKLIEDYMEAYNIKNKYITKDMIKHIIKEAQKEFRKEVIGKYDTLDSIPFMLWLKELKVGQVVKNTKD